MGCSARLKMLSLIGIEPKSIIKECRVFASSTQKLSNTLFYVILELWPTESGNLPEW